MSKMSLADKNNNGINTNKSLSLDEAYLSIYNEINDTVSLYSIIDECNECNGLLWTKLIPNSNTTLSVSTRYPLYMYYIKSNQQWCPTTFKFQEYGHYGWIFSDTKNCSNIYTLLPPNNPYLPLLVAFILVTIAFIIIVTTKYMIKVAKRFTSRNASNEPCDLSSLQESDLSTQFPIRISRVSTRVKSIDTFRGIATLLMIFVNNGGGKYIFFNHAPWNGLTVADLVLPWFAWIMGVTIVLSLRSQFRLSMLRSRIIFTCLRRAVTLIFLGLIINSLNNEHRIRLRYLRFPGVLQLLGITYFVCTSIEVIGMTSPRNFQYGRFSFLQDILDAWIQWLIILCFITTHLFITFLLPVPGCPRGYLGPGGYESHGIYANCTAGAAGYIDRKVFGNHIYMKRSNPIVGPVLPHDPEGLLNTLSAVFIVALGVQAGRILFCSYLHSYSKIGRWLAWSVVLGISSGILCDSNNGGIIPVNKNMMTLTFVLTTSCFAFIIFAILYYFIDHLRLWDGAPFTYAGINSILLYVGHYFSKNTFPWAWEISHPTHTSFLAMNLWTTTLWTLIAYFLYKKDIIITV